MFQVAAEAAEREEMAKQSVKSSAAEKVRVAKFY